MEKHRRISFIILFLGLFIFSLSIYSIIVDSVYGVAERLSFRATDYSNLIFGVPYLLTAAYFLYEQRDLWIWVTPGALFYTAYVYLPYAIALGSHIFFLAYVLVIVVSLYLMIILLASHSYKDFEAELAEAPVRLIAGILLLLGLFVALRQTGFAFMVALGRASATSIDVALWIDDLVLGCPPMILSAYYLIKRKGVAYVTGPAILLCYGVLSLGLLPYFILERIYTGGEFQWDGTFIIVGMAILCLLPFARLVQWRIKRRRAE